MTNPDPSGEGSTCADERRAREAEYYLKAAWKRLAPAADTSRFPRGFWPDLARVAVEMALAHSADISLNWQPPMCTRGSWPEPEPRPPRTGTRSRGGKISAAERAANTAKLLAALKGA